MNLTIKRIACAATLALGAVSAWAQADFVGTATAVRLLPVQSQVSNTPAGGTPSTTPSGAPAGYEAVTYPIGAGTISPSAYQAAIANGYTPVTCNYGMFPSGDGCTDGKPVTAVMNPTLPCNNAFNTAVYAVNTYSCNNVTSGDGSWTCTPTGTQYRSCVAAGTTLTTLRQVAATGATPIEVPFNTFNFAAGGDGNGTNVAYETTTLNQLCRGLGYGLMYGAAPQAWNSCGNNRLRVFRSGAWITVGGCDYPNWTERLVCWSQ